MNTKQMQTVQMDGTVREKDESGPNDHPKISKDKDFGTNEMIGDHLQIILTSIELLKLSIESKCKNVELATQCDSLIDNVIFLRLPLDWN
jgi:hypothetical protein